MDTFFSLLRWSCTASGLLLIALALLIVVDVLSRWVLNRPLVGVFEASGVSFVLISFLALGWVQKQARQMRIDILTGRVTGRSATAIEIMTNLFVLTFFGMLLWRSVFQWLDAWQVGDVFGSTVRIPMILPVGAIVLGTAFLCVTLVIAVVVDVLRLVSGAPAPVDRERLEAQDL